MLPESAGDGRRPLITSVHHYGPDVRFPGGIATVLSLIRRHNIGSDHVVLHSTWVPGSRLRSAWLTANAIRDLQTLPAGATVHVHFSHRGSFLREGAVLRAAARRNLATVASIHGSDFVGFAQRLPYLVRAALADAKVVTVLTEASAAALQKLMPALRVVLVPNPVQMRTCAEPADRTPPMVLFAGEIGRRKGADVLARAWRIVSAEISDARCVAIGPVVGLDPASDLDGMEIHPPGSADTVGQLLCEARVAVLPSRAEAMPMFLLEAMAAGRPFIGTPVGSVSELAQHGGVVVPVGDAQGLAAEIISFFRSGPTAATLGARGREFCIRTRSPSVIDAAFRALYESVKL